MTTPLNTNNPSTREGPNGQRLCHAKNSAGEPCKGLAMQGQNVCRVHGGAAPQNKDKARLRLFDLVDPSLTRLARLIATTNDEQVLLKAVNSVLDRTGYQRGYQITIEDARAMLAERLTAAQEHEDTQ